MAYEVISIGSLASAIAVRYGATEAGQTAIEIVLALAKSPVPIVGLVAHVGEPHAPAPAIVVPFRKPLAAIELPRRRGAWPGTYEEYTATKEFARIAAIARKEWHYQCAINITHRGHVEMHHRTYLGVPFGEGWQDLIPLCEDCHALYHHKLPKPPIGLFDEIVIVNGPIDLAA